MKKIIVLMGKSSTGKDTLVKGMSTLFKIPISVSYTTRPMREGEVDGVDYHFISQDEFEEMKKLGKFVETTNYEIESEDRVYSYGTTFDELTKADYVLTILNPHGVTQLREKGYKDDLITVLLDCDDRERLLRALNRDKNCNVREIIDRFGRDSEDFDINPIEVDYIIDNSRDKTFAFLSLSGLINSIVKEGEDKDVLVHSS